jgi:hypothetical protein
MKTISLTDNHVALVDDDLFEHLNQWNWRAVKDGNTIYVKRNFRIGSHVKTIQMHRLIMELSHGDGKQVDHIDGNGLNNQKANLRICTNSQNHANIPKRFGKSVFKGVYFNTGSQKWLAQIRVNNQRKHLGYFAREKDAAVAYNKAALIHFGEFAKLNNIKKEINHASSIN